MADIPLQQRSGVDDVGRTIVPLPGLALEPVYNAAANVQKQTTADFEAQQMEKVKVKTIAAQNALNLIAEEQKRRGITPLRVQAVTEGDTFANRAFLKTAQEISRTMTIDQVHADLQDELIQLRTDYLTHSGQMAYDPANPHLDNAAKYSATAFAILNKYHEKYSTSPYVDDVFDAQMTAKFTGTVNTFTKEIREHQATKIVANYQTGLLEGMQKKMAVATDKALATGFAHSTDFNQAHKTLIEPLVNQIKDNLRLLEASGADSGTMRQAILASHDVLTEQFKNGVFLELTQMPATTPQELAEKNKKIGAFVDYINRGGAFYENQIIKMPKEDEFDGGGLLVDMIDELFTKNIDRDEQEFTSSIGSEAELDSYYKMWIGTVKSDKQRMEIEQKYHTMKAELAASRAWESGDRAERERIMTSLEVGTKGAKKPDTPVYDSWRTQMTARSAKDKAKIDVNDPIKVGVPNIESGRHEFEVAVRETQNTVVKLFSQQEKSPWLEDVTQQVNDQLQAAGQPVIDVKTPEGQIAMSRLIALDSLPAVMALQSDQWKARARPHWARVTNSDPVSDHSGLPDETFEKASVELNTLVAGPDKTEFLQRAAMYTEAMQLVDGVPALDSNLKKLDKDTPKGEIGVGAAMVVARNARELDPSQRAGQAVLTWYAAGKGKSLDVEVIDLKMDAAVELVKNYPGELKALGAGDIGSPEQSAFLLEMLKGAYYTRDRGVVGKDPLLSEQQRKVDQEAARDNAIADVKGLLDMTRANTKLTPNYGLGGRVSKVPGFLTEADVKSLGYILSPETMAGKDGEAQARTTLSQDFPDSFGDKDLSQYEAVVVGDTIQFRQTNSSVYDTEYLLWPSKKLDVQLNRFVTPGSRLQLVDQTPGAPVAYSLRGFAEEKARQLMKQREEQEEQFKIARALSGTVVTGGAHDPTNNGQDSYDVLRAQQAQIDEVAKIAAPAPVTGRAAPPRVK